MLILSMNYVRLLGYYWEEQTKVSLSSQFEVNFVRLKISKATSPLPLTQALVCAHRLLCTVKLLAKTLMALPLPP